MTDILSKLQAAGVQIQGEAAVRSHLAETDNSVQGLLALARQGRSIGVSFSAEPLTFNGPALVEALQLEGFTSDQAKAFFANTNIQIHNNQADHAMKRITP